ncbi:hypothetical protein D6D21_10035 [Aureobasidium pullulans]|uniref:Uncharacterized protein n=1 Tax=Aureobasidium pullulans TaxID=5580 RepID=A0AB74IJE6_AURPU|nr:hypothetical protein D6D21_10035 [Aureobasidium pullulans]THX21912.1 hypothetical protein D6D12_09622 [Aureobasidium pullulans]THX47137.1 hypothetical protein D6D11_06565 [Aureobasidium pullulans]THX82873.1 hypothetical protein D6D08_04713 [Aureobasidium pullulans]
MFIPTISTVLSALSTLSGLAAIPTQHPSSSSDVALNPHDVVISSQTRVGRVTESCYQPILGLRQCTMYTGYGDSFRGEAAAKTTMSSKPTETPGDDTEDEVVTVTVDAPEKIVTVTTTEEPETVWEDVITTVHVTSTVDLPEVTVTETAKASTTIDEPKGTAERIRHHPKTSATPSTKRAKPSSSASSPASKKTSSFSDRRSKKPKTTSASAVASTAVASSASTSASSSNPLRDLFDSLDSYYECPPLMPKQFCEDFKLKKIRASSASVSASATASATSDSSPPFLDDFTVAWTAPPSSAPTTMGLDDFTIAWTAPPSPAPTTMGTVVKVNIVVEATQSATTQSLDWEDKVDDPFENRDWFVPKNFTLHGSRTV